MCGLVALLTPDTSFPMSILRDMRDRIAHRGPDDAGELIESTGQGVLGMGHRRLSIIDLSPLGHQPMEDMSGRYVIVFNGEIYNYIELREQLISKGYTFKSESDTEVLLAAYACWGEECLLKLNGMFAFALWDRSEKILFVARDRFGEKPLYYTSLPQGGIALASEAKALFAHPDVYPQINESVVSAFMNGITSYVDKEIFFKDIFRLPPAHCMTIDLEGNIQSIRRYWMPDYTNNYTRKSRASLAEEFRNRLEKSVAMRLRSDVKVGACLSGGLDSSTIVGLLKVLEEKDQATLGYTYSARFENDPTMSEGSYIDDMLGYKNIPSSSVNPHGRDIINESQRLHWHQEQPFLSASMYLEWCVTRDAKKHGTTVLLDGQGSDEVLAGYQHYFKNHQYDQIARGHWIDAALNTHLFNSRLQKEVARYDDGKRRIDVAVAHQMSDFLHLIGKAFLYHTRPLRRPSVNKWEGLPEAYPANTLRYTLAKGVMYDMLANNLHSADCNGMAHAVETRFPYLDYDLVEWCLRLPSDVLIKYGWQKHILRQAAKNIIPESIRWRVDKVGFAAPQDQWLRHDLKNWSAERLFEGPITTRPEYDHATIEKLWFSHQSGESDQSWELWRWISLNEWLSLFESGAWKKGLPEKSSTDKATQLTTARSYG